VLIFPQFKNVFDILVAEHKPCKVW